jgi:hypothetical protein
MPEPKAAEEKVVFIKCRAKADCPGMEAAITLIHANSPYDGTGGFVPEVGGRMVRYRCKTCGGTFTIRT